MLQQTLYTQFVQGIEMINGKSGVPPCADAVQQWFYATEYINENPNLTPDIAATGGFDMNFSLDVPIVVGEGPQVAINFSYAWGLTDGILAVSPTENGNYINQNSSRAITLRLNLEDGLQTAVPTGIYQAALAAQRVDPFPKAQDCVPMSSAGVGGLDTLSPVLLSDNGLGAEAFALTGAIAKAVTDGTFASLGLDDSQLNLSGLSPSSILGAPITEPDPATSTVFHNWVCAYTCPDGTQSCKPANAAGGGGGHYRYQFVPRARRLNFYPDSVELVWTDDLPNEVGPLTNAKTVTSGVSLYVILFDQYLQAYGSGNAFSNGGPFDNLSTLCNGIPASSRSRSFSVYSGGYQDADLVGGTGGGAMCVGGQITNSLLPWNIISTITGIQATLSSFFGNLF